MGFGENIRRLIWLFRKRYSLTHAIDISEKSDFTSSVGDRNGYRNAKTSSVCFQFNIVISYEEQGAGYLWGFLYCVVNHFPIILWQGMLPEPSGAKSRIKQSILVAFYHFGLFFSLKISRITPRRKVITINVIIFH